MKLIEFKRINSLCLTVVIIVFTVFGCFGESGDMLQANASDNSITFIIDPGHGGMDGGASGLNGSLEKELNLIIGKNIYEILNVLGYNVVMTRNEDVMLGNGEKGQAKMNDLKYRLEMASGYSNGILVSIHMNKFPKENTKGMTLYYSPNNEKSIKIAEKIRDNNIKYLQSDNNREMKKADSAIYLLNRINIPAVLVECGFLSNDEESRLLMSEEHQKKISLVIAMSIIE